MQEDRFWELIGDLRVGAQRAVPRMKRLLARLLAQMTDGEVAGFADRWREMDDRADCWPLLQAVVVAFGGCSDDTFMDVRTWLICQSRPVYTAVIAEPDTLLEYVGPAGEEVFGDAESFTSVIWEELDGRPHSPHVHEEPAAVDPRPWGVRIDLSDRDVVHAHYPRCAAAREAYLATPLPAVTIPTERPTAKRPPPRTLTLGTTWRSRRDNRP